MLKNSLTSLLFVAFFCSHAFSEQVIHCKYKIPAETKEINQSLLLTWSKNALIQAFSFDSATIDKQLEDLKPCFTDQGWLSFSEAFEHSGNLQIIKQQKLQLSSALMANPQIKQEERNQWKLTLPLQVSYQNEKEKFQQQLIVELRVGRKINGDLGIIQLIATPKKNNSK